MSVVDIRQNLFWAFVNNMVGIPPAGLGLFGPDTGWVSNGVLQRQRSERPVTAAAQASR
jgi:cation transport ATPase